MFIERISAIPAETRRMVFELYSAAEQDDWSAFLSALSQHGMPTRERPHRSLDNLGFTMEAAREFYGSLRREVAIAKQARMRRG